MEKLLENVLFIEKQICIIIERYFNNCKIL